jgi:hypothetical protein
VSLTFEGTKEGHALDAFETTDKGLVYIDCTNGGNVNVQNKSTQTWDAIAYIEKGKKYGVLTVERVLAAPDYYDPLEYDFYAECEKTWQEYETKLQAYNDEVDRYNREIGNKVITFGSQEASRFAVWEERLSLMEKDLENLKEQTGGHWLESEYSSYLVKSVNIHW